MILAVAATEIEMAPFLAESTVSPALCQGLVSGVGPVETAVRLTRFLCEREDQFASVIQFGVGGAYLQPDEKRQQQPEILDICLARQEVAGDFGICLGESVDYLNNSLTGEIVYDMDALLMQRCQTIFDQGAIKYTTGVFITVNGMSGTTVRGRMLQARWNGLCENMEGAAVARVCREFRLPYVELRCISNFVVDRDPSSWRMQEACRKAAHVALLLIRGLST